MFLVTGGTGFLGRRLVKELASQGYVLRCLMRPLVWGLERLLSQPPVTLGMLAMLNRDNITDLDAVERIFGFKPTPLKADISHLLR